MKLTRAQLEKNFDTLSYFLDCLTLFYGQMGAGKTTNAVAMAYWMKNLFEIPVISVGTTVGLKPAFGDFHHLPVKAFLEQMMLIGKISQEILDENIPEDDIDNHLKWCKANQGLELYRCILLVDELYKYCNARYPNDPVNNSIQDFVAQMRHYHCTFIGMTPDLKDVDRKMRDCQVRWKCKPDHDDDTGWYTLRFRGPQRPLTMRIYGPDYAGKYPGDPEGMFNSWAFPGFNSKRVERALSKGV